MAERRNESSLGSFYKGTNPIHEAPPDFFPKALSTNSITLGVRISTNKLAGQGMEVGRVDATFCLLHAGTPKNNILLVFFHYDSSSYLE